MGADLSCLKSAAQEAMMEKRSKFPEITMITKITRCGIIICIKRKHMITVKSIQRTRQTGIMGAGMSDMCVHVCVNGTYINVGMTSPAVIQ